MRKEHAWVLWVDISGIRRRWEEPAGEMTGAKKTSVFVSYCMFMCFTVIITSPYSFSKGIMLWMMTYVMAFSAELMWKLTSGVRYLQIIIFQKLHFDLIFLNKYLI